MTALARYQRLECGGLWREAPGAQRVEVAVSFGDATLVIVESRSGRALAHWSLPAVVRLNPEAHPALYAPGLDAAETLEIDDLDMIAAIGAVRAALDRPARRGRRLRLTLLAGVAAGVAALAVFWLPGAVADHAAAVVPMAKRAEIGRALLADVEAATGPACRAPAALPALARLRDALPALAEVEIVVLPADRPLAAHLPGRLVLVSRRLIEGEDGPEALAAAILAERLRAEAADPLEAVLRRAGLLATFALLTTGDLPPGALHGEGRARLAAPPAPLEARALAARLAAAGVPAEPFLRLAPPGIEGLAAADPATGGATLPLLSDDDWVRLQGICDR